MAERPFSLHVIGSKTLGGAEGFFLRLIQGLARQGAPVAAAVRKGSQVEAALPSGIPAVALPLRTVWDPLSKRELTRAIRGIGPQVVQTYMGRATRLCRTELPHIARLGGYYKLAGYRHADAWVGNTRGICAYLKESGFPASRVFYIPNFVPLPRGVVKADRQAWGIPEGAPVLLHAGRFIPVKGHRLLLEALARLPRVWLVLLGAGPLEGELRRMAQRLGVDARIVWAGWQGDPSPFYALADLVVFPSLERETLGNVVLEAWAHRRAVVVTRFRGAREITRHGIDAWQVPCGDARALARGIGRVLEDDALRSALAEAGHRRILTEFSEEKVVSAYLALYRRFA